MTCDAQIVKPGMQEGVLAAALDALTVHVAVLDADGRIVATNEAWRRFASTNGAEHHEAVAEGRDYLDASRGADDPTGRLAARGIEDVLAGRRDEFRLEYPCHSPDELRWFELRATRMPDGAGVVVAHSAVTDRKLAEQRLEYLAHHDELTGLANRRWTMATLMEHQRTGRLGVILLDLDHFKTINDTYGHGAGNRVLKAVAEAIGTPLENGSLAGRHGGDEFCIALFDCDETLLKTAGAAVCQRVREHLARLPFGESVSVSAGGTIVRADEPLTRALHRADEALYAVKLGGRDDFRSAG